MRVSARVGVLVRLSLPQQEPRCGDSRDAPTYQSVEQALPKPIRSSWTYFKCGNAHDSAMKNEV